MVLVGAKRLSNRPAVKAVLDPEPVIRIRQTDRLDLPEAVIAVCLEQGHEVDDPQVLSRAPFLANQASMNPPSTTCPQR